MALNKCRSGGNLLSSLIATVIGNKASSSSSSLIMKRQMPASYSVRLSFTSSAFLSQKLSSMLYSTDSAPNEDGPKRIESAFMARQFIETLTKSERSVIKEELLKYEQEQAQLTQNPKVVPRPSFKQLLAVGATSSLPFIGFGFVDNFLMIVAGDLIESYIGFFLPLSTMAAAGFGNAVSDVAGIGLAHHIEFWCSRFTNEPVLTAEQFNLPMVSWFMVISKSLAIFVGCVIGMFPLLFINHKEKDEESKTNLASNNK